MKTKRPALTEKQVKDLLGAEVVGIGKRYKITRVDGPIGMIYLAPSGGSFYLDKVLKIHFGNLDPDGDVWRIREEP